MGWLQFDWNYRSPLAVRCCWWNARTSRLQSMEHHGKLKSLIIKNHGKLKTLMIETHESKTNISPSCLFQTVFLHVGVDHNLSLKNNKCFCHRNLSYMDNIHNSKYFTWLCHHIAGIPISSLWRKPIPNGFYGGFKWPHFAPKSQVDGWLNHPSQPKYAHVNRFHLKITSFGYENFRALTGFVLPILNITDQDVVCFFPGNSSFYVPYTGLNLYTSNIQIHTASPSQNHPILEG